MSRSKEHRDAGHTANVISVADAAPVEIAWLRESLARRPDQAVHAE
jgi:hypothetical protein